MVLLKNDDILPLKRNKQKIALIGPYADSLDIVGMWLFTLITNIQLQ